MCFGLDKLMFLLGYAALKENTKGMACLGVGCRKCFGLDKLMFLLGYAGLNVKGKARLGVGCCVFWFRQVDVLIGLYRFKRQR